MYPMGVITRRAAAASASASASTAMASSTSSSGFARSMAQVTISPAIQNAARANVRGVARAGRPRMGMWVAGAGVAGLTAGVVGEMR
uniref:Predicted protein n=1 Tax=Hordeum vulgare subsp. vulgare TaxID=112509 RepID=F2DLI6_HORVV|nr:predicted protein [Hordeum vulgare subsp. vulgare]